MFEVHRIRLRDTAARHDNSVRIDNTWAIAQNCDAPAVGHAAEDYKKYFEESFGFSLAEKSEKNFSFLLDETMGNSFGIDIADDKVVFVGGTYEAIVQAVFYSEDMMNAVGAPFISACRVSPKVFPRTVASALGINEFPPEYLNILLHNGYNGIILYDTAPFEDAAKTAKEYGLRTYLVTENIDTYENIDAVIFEKEPDEKSINSSCTHKCIFSAEYWQNDNINKLPQNSVVLLSFDEGQLIERDGVKAVSRHGSLLMSQASDKFVKMKEEAEKRNITVWASTGACGRTCELRTLPFVPAMMQWMLRNGSLLEQNVKGTVESGYIGLYPSIVSEFFKLQLLSPCDGAGITVQKLSLAHYGAKNTEKMMTVFKKISDGVNCLFADDADISGPLAYGPAYPLVQKAIYDFPFDKKDITYETDMMLRAADGFNKASMILKNIEGKEANELRIMCAFAVNTLVTCANAKRWYRRVHVLQNEKTDYKRKFLIEQMLKIGNEEIRNAAETAELIFELPALGELWGEQLCTVDRLEAKISLTQNAMQALQNECETAD